MSPIAVGEKLPSIKVKETAPDAPIDLPTEGKIIVVGVPGCFTPTCSSQVPGYVLDYDSFAAKGVKEIFVIAVNDAFVTKAWGKSLAPEGTKVRFLADDTGAFVEAAGLSFDASGFLGTKRSVRFALVAVDGVVESIAIEDSPGDLKVTSSEAILAKL